MKDKVFSNFPSNYIKFIAEIGINHNGSVDLAKSMISAAKIAGCDFVKFQKRNPEVSTPRHMRDKLRETPWGEMTYLEYKKKIEFSSEDYRLIDRYCRELGIEWTVSIWDQDSLEFALDFELPFLKVPSALITNIEFLERVAEAGKPTVVSTGMCNWEHIDACVATFKNRNTPLALMHTVSTYPCPPENLNLSLIPLLKKRYGIEIGYSGHETSISPTIVAAALGAEIIERHITLDRSMWGTDQSASVEVSGLNYLIGSLRKLPKIIGDGEKKFEDSERLVASKLRYW